MTALFDSIKVTAPKRSKFDLSHEKKLSLNMGELVPVMCLEVVPGDELRVNSEVLMRLAPMLAPVMHRVNVWLHSYYVPTRLIWTEFEDYITGGRLGTSAPVVPFMDVATQVTTSGVTWKTGSLADYLGIPPWDGAVDAVNNPRISALPFRVYQTIYDEYYRDQNLTADLAMTLASGQVPAGVETVKLLTLRKRAWEKDYFTSGLPFVQRGAAVAMPVSGNAVVNYLPTSLLKTTAGGVPTANRLVGSAATAINDFMINKPDAPTPGVTGRVENISSIDVVGLGVSINELRRSNKLQMYLELNARAGGRYIEQILGRFGVKSKDERLDRPEFIGGGRQPVVMSEVVSTFQETGGTIPQGTMAGHGISVGNQNGYKKFAEEHGYVMTIMSVLPRTAYQNGIARIFNRKDRYEILTPEFVNLGEQPVRYHEIQNVYNNPGEWAGPGQDAFCYQSRYADWKYEPSSVHGDFRSTLNFWHMSRDFGTSGVTFNASFIEADPTHRIFAVVDPTKDKLWVQVYHNISALRPLPYYGTPTL